MVIKKQSGFTILEIMVAISLLGVITSVVGPSLVTSRILEQERLTITRTAEQIQRIGIAAQRRSLDNTGIWPDEVNACAGAFGVLNGLGLVDGITANSPQGGPWVISCASGSPITISNTMADADDAQRLKRQVTGSIVAGTVVTANYPQPSSIALFAGAFMKDGSELATGSFDMDGNDIVNAGDIILETGQSMTTAVYYKTSWTPGSGNIPKPTCPAGFVPFIHVDGWSVLRLPSGKAIHAKHPSITSFATFWTPAPRIWGPDGEEGGLTADNVQLTISTRCAA